VPPLPRVLRSPIHLGALIAVALAVVVVDDQAVDVVAVAVGFEILVIGSYLGIRVFAALAARYDHELDEARRVLLESEHRDHAHWIHDDVLSEIRLSRLRLERGEIAAADLPAELEAIEHRLRVRQLDEVVRSGSATVAEIVQPYLRLANSADVTLSRVPSYEVGAWRVGPATGMLLKRAFAVPIANAIQAGASVLAVEVHRRGPFLEVEVEDDAGGFEPEGVHRGRGLDVLDHDLEPGGVTVTRSSHGTQVMCRVPLRNSDGAWRQSASADAGRRGSQVVG
jgi:hypothetical protein